MLLILLSLLQLTVAYQPCSDLVQRISSAYSGHLTARLSVTLDDALLTQADVQLTFTQPVKFLLNGNEWTNESSATVNWTAYNISNKFEVVFEVSFKTHPYIDVSKVAINNRVLCSEREVCGEIPDSQFLIQRGETVQDGEWPWLAAIFLKTDVTTLNFMCGGTLVSARHVITAAHCVRDVNSYCELADRKDLIVGLGVHKLFDIQETGVQKFGVSGVMVHSDWGAFRQGANDADLAVILLSRDALFTDRIRPACLDFRDQEGTSGTVVGWGLNEKGEFYSEPNRATLPIVSTQVCRDADRRYEPITSQRTFCAGKQDGVGPCKGDSGGGFFTLNAQPGDRPRVSVSGVVSRALVNSSFIGVCDLFKYAIFTRLSSYKDWIQDGIRKDRFDEKEKQTALVKQIDMDNEKALKQLVSGNISVAFDSFEKILEGRICTLGDKHRDTLRAFYNSVFLSLNEPEETVRLLSELIEEQKRVLGDEDDPDIIASMHSKAAALAKAGLTTEALELYFEVLEKRRRVSGELNEDTLHTMTNILVLLSQSGQYNKALGLAQELLEKQGRVYGPDHFRTLLTKHNLAFVLQEMGRYTEALEHLESVIEKRRELLGPNHPDTLASTLNKAQILHNQFKDNEASSLIDQVISSSTLNDDTQLKALNLKALILNRLNDFKAALSLYDEIIEKATSLFGLNNSITFKAIKNKAYTLNNVGRHIEALNLYDQILEQLMNNLSAIDHVDILHNRAFTFYKLNRNEEALDLYRQVIDKRKFILGDMHTETLNSMLNYAAILASFNRYQEALPLNQHVLDSRRKVLGDYNQDTLVAMNNVAFNLVKLEEYQQAVSIWDKVIDIQTKLFGENNMLAIVAAYNRQFAANKFAAKIKERQQISCDNLKAEYFASTVELHKKRYYISTKQATWQAAREDCMSQGMDLVQIDDSMENQRLVQYLNQIYQTDSWVFWIGARDLTWSGTQQSLNFTFWLDDRAANGCVAMYGSVHPDYCSTQILPCSGRWIPEDCTHQWHYICACII